LAVYYNDAVKPTDPYEFVGLLKNQPMLAVKRNQALLQLAESLSANLPLVALLDEARASGDLQGDSGWEGVKAEIVKLPEGLGFLERFNGVLRDFMDVSYDGERLAGRPDLLVQSLIEMSRASRKQDSQASRLPDGPGGPEELEQRLLEAVGEKRADEALAVIAIARTSWKLRDDDNILIGRLDYQLLRALDLSAERLRAAGRLGSKEKVAAGHARIIAGALKDPGGSDVALPKEKKDGPVSGSRNEAEKARQIIGQPAAPGVATGMARIVRGAKELGGFSAGEVLVCDSIQPTMSHLVPLAAGIAERRGGMLIHGAIVARELGIPCVNGLKDVVDLIKDGEIVTVDGYLGIVTVGPPEFDMEKSV
jgi:pyruvate,water dikinase